MSTTVWRRAIPPIGLAILGLVILTGCGGGGKSTSSSGSSTQTPSDHDFGDNDPRRVTAFGDSVTFGVLEQRQKDSKLNTSNNYPNILQSMLRGLDPAWRVVNRGRPGEEAREGVGRFPGVLGLDRPGFVLIMEGTNDASDDDDPSFIVANLEAMVLQALGNKSIPVIGTIPPNFRNDFVARDIIDSANVFIRTMARSRRVVLAEVFNGMNDRSLFGLSPNRDPLHPNERGYSVMAGIWFDAMKQAIPTPAPAPPPPASPAPGSPTDPAPPTTAVDGKQTVKTKR